MWAYIVGYASYFGYKCPQEGMIKCFYYKEIDNYTSSDNGCYPKTLENICPKNLYINSVLIVVIISNVTWFLIGFMYYCKLMIEYHHRIINIKMEKF